MKYYHTKIKKMIHNYNITVNKTTIQKNIHIPDSLFNRIKENTENYNNYINSKIMEYQWEFDNKETYQRIIESIKKDLN